MNIGGNTPWGPAQHISALAEGITFVQTASHGGVILSAERAKKLASLLPGFTPFTGRFTALEEDADAALVVLAWPEYFKAETIAQARESVESDPDYYTGSATLLARTAAASP